MIRRSWGEATEPSCPLCGVGLTRGTLHEQCAVRLTRLLCTADRESLEDIYGEPLGEDFTREREARMSSEPRTEDDPLTAEDLAIAYSVMGINEGAIIEAAWSLAGSEEPDEWRYRALVWHLFLKRGRAPALAAGMIALGL